MRGKVHAFQMSCISAQIFAAYTRSTTDIENVKVACLPQFQLIQRLANMLWAEEFLPRALNISIPVLRLFFIRIQHYRCRIAARNLTCIQSGQPQFHLAVVTWIQFQIAVEPCDRLFSFARLRITDAHPFERLFQRGRKFQRLAEIFNRFLKFILVLQHHAEIAVAFGKIRAKKEYPAITFFRLGKLPVAFIDVAQVVLHFGHVRLDLQRATITINCFVELFGQLIDVAEIVLDHLRARIDFRRLPQEFQSLGQVPLLRVKRAQQIIRIKMHGVMPQRALVKIFRSGKIALLVFAEPLLEIFLALLVIVGRHSLLLVNLREFQISRISSRPWEIEASPHNTNQDGVFFLNSADCACACKPSPNANVEAMPPSFCAPSAETWIRLLRFWKSYTPSGDEKRAVPDVGST